MTLIIVVTIFVIVPMIIGYLMHWSDENLKFADIAHDAGESSEENRSNDATSTPSSSAGVYAINYDARRGSRRAELIISTAPELLPDVFLDLVERMGEQVVLTLGEKSTGALPGHLVSFTPLVKSHRLQTSLAEFADVLSQTPALSLTAQNQEKCCAVTLNPEKVIFLEACNVAQYREALERRGLSEVQANSFEHYHEQNAVSAMHEVSDERLSQLKQRLEISSSYLADRAWLN